MKRIYCNKDTDAVEMIFDLEEEPSLKDELGPYTYLYHYMVDYDGKEDISYSYSYNKKTEKFYFNKNYKEIPVYFEANGLRYETPEEARAALNLSKTRGIGAQQVDALMKENEELKNELSMIKKHLGL